MLNYFTLYHKDFVIFQCSEDMLLLKFSRFDLKQSWLDFEYTNGTSSLHLSINLNFYNQIQIVFPHFS